jgi:hypothetical protein
MEEEQKKEGEKKHKHLKYNKNNLSLSYSGIQETILTKEWLMKKTHEHYAEAQEG